MSLDTKKVKQEKLILLPEYDYKKPNNHDKIICDFILKETLGKGTFGVVKLAINKQTGEKVAIKVINEKNIPTEEKLNFYREIDILKTLKHPNIIRIYSHITKEKQIYLITEYIKGIELFQYISLKKKIEEKEACLYFQQIICGLEYLHKMGIVHRDIKAENILVDHHLKEIKIIDFGLSNKYTKKSNLLSTLCGSPHYAAPEVLQGRGYKPRPVDIWSAGIVLYYMLSGKLPFQGDSDQDLYKKIIDGNIKNIDGVSKEANDLIKNILNPNPMKRINISQIKKHPWFNLFNNNNFQIMDYYGLLTNKYVIPVDEDIVNEIKNTYGINDEEIRTSILGNKLNDICTLYYLIVTIKNKEGIKSISDFKSDIFINYIKNENNLLKNYGNDINYVIKVRKKGIDKEKEIISEIEESKKIRGKCLEGIIPDEQRDRRDFRSLSPSMKNSNYELIRSNTQFQSPKSLSSFENSDYNSNSNYKYKRIDTDIECIKPVGNGKFKKLLIKANTNKINFVKRSNKKNPPLTQKRKMGKNPSNNNYKKGIFERIINNKFKGGNFTNLTCNLSSEKKTLEEEKLNKLIDKNKKTDKEENINKNKNDKKIKKVINDKNIRNEKEKPVNLAKTEINSGSKGPIGKAPEKLRNKIVDKKFSEIKISTSENKSKSNIAKEKEQLSYNYSSKKTPIKSNDEKNLLNKKNKTGLLYKNKKNSKNKNKNYYLNTNNNDNSNNNKNLYLKTEKTNKEEDDNKKDMNRYFSEDFLDIKKRNKKSISKSKKSKLYKIKKNLKLNIDNEKKRELLPTYSNRYLNSEQNKINNNNRNFISLSNFDIMNINDDNNNDTIEPFDLNSICLKKKGEIKKEFIEKLEKRKIKYKKISNYCFVVEMKKDICFETEITKNKNNTVGNICILKIKKIKGNNESIFNCLKSYKLI